ncbi:DUF2244 domain-containing protein [Paracoccus caeni]|uniref:DUF2244 domain-containing protein n=1 Tax=Paracoccus caeni TaxID=657651 RepID=A0A934SGM4_9RHOB|nr:DUF2244 domain-containing protein [Paracoccus caeni]MBK4217074.1 DUF2244 domain-containing protein [Paracoccus caeni]
MPYEWQIDTAPEDSGAVSYRLRLWPYQSLPATGFVWFIGITAGLLSLPMLAVVGTTALWGLLPFAGLAIWAIWFALQRSYRKGQTYELLDMNHNALHLQRHDPKRPVREWKTNSYWVRASLRNGPVEHYLTLTDGQREVELGAFLTPEERVALRDELQDRLGRLRR